MLTKFLRRIGCSEPQLHLSLNFADSLTRLPNGVVLLNQLAPALALVPPAEGPW
jgi:hypothetical protein